MSSLVIDQISQGFELSAALIALERCLPSVSSHVNYKVTLLEENSSTVFIRTEELGVVCMHTFLVLQESRFSRK
jgi:hypothetical protein